MSIKDSTNFWCISDTHFGHDKMIKEGLRPEGYHIQIQEEIQKNVREQDVLIHLGDVSFYDHAYWNLFITEWWGKKILVRGNHDKKSYAWYMNHGWDLVVDEMKMNMYSYEILFTHVPAYQKWDDRTDFDINVHGHLHDDNHRSNKLVFSNQRLVYTNFVNLRTLVGK